MVKKIVQLIIFLGLGIFFIWLSVKDLQPKDVETIKESAVGILNPESLFFIFISMICGLTAHYFRALRNILLINPLGYKVRKTTAFYSVMTCYLANLAIPRLGEVLRCTFLQRYDNVPFQKSLGTVFVERALDFLVFLLLFVFLIIFNSGLLAELDIAKQTGSWLSDKWESIWAMKKVMICVLIGIIIGFVILKYLINKRTKHNQKKTKILGFIRNIVKGLWQGLISVKDLKHPYLFIFQTIIIWVFYFLGVYFCFFAFDFLQKLGPMPAFIVLVVGSIGFMVSQGGLGAYPLIVAGILILYDVDYAQGLAAGWIGWCAQTLMILAVGFTVLVLASFLKLEDRSSG
jgi:uncharacterized protein (TIRG00374 family)